MKNRTGLVSVSFRKKTPEQIVAAVKESGLECIEWGGDIHAPHGDVCMAQYLNQLCRDNGISISQYGSYYIVGYSAPELWDSVLASARALGTNIIRVWPGQNIVVKEIGTEKYLDMVNDAKRICDAAPDITVALECHGSSLTEHYDTALKFISDVDRKNIKMFWQPNQSKSFEYDLEAIDRLLPYIVSVHTFFWDEKSNRFPLADGAERWREYIRHLSSHKLTYMLEFIRGDDITLLPEEADTLRSLIE